MDWLNKKIEDTQEALLVYICYTKWEIKPKNNQEPIKSVSI